MSDDDGMTCLDCGTGPLHPSPFDAFVKNCECGEVAWLDPAEIEEEL